VIGTGIVADDPRSAPSFLRLLPCPHAAGRRALLGALPPPQAGEGVASLFGIFIIPLLYITAEGLRQWAWRRKKK